MNNKKTVFRIVIAAVACCAVLAVCILTGLMSGRNADTGSSAGTPDTVKMSPGILDALDQLDSEITFSDEVYEHISENWARWNEKDSMERALSSSIPGHWNGMFETWDEALSCINIKLWNPFESANWLQKMNVYGADIKQYGLIEHCCFTAYADLENSVTFADISAGYASGTSRIVCTVYLCPTLSEEDNYDSNSMIRHIRYTRGNEIYKCTAATRKGEKYDALDLIFSGSGSGKYFISITSFEGTKELARVFDKVSEELGMSLSYDFLFNEYQDDTVDVTIGRTGDSSDILIASIPTHLS